MLRVENKSPIRSEQRNGRADYVWGISEGVVYLIDLDQGSKSLTNDMAYALGDLLGDYGLLLYSHDIIYRDSTRRWDVVDLRSPAEQPVKDSGGLPLYDYIFISLDAISFGNVMRFVARQLGDGPIEIPEPVGFQLGCPDDDEFTDLPDFTCLGH